MNTTVSKVEINYYVSMFLRSKSNKKVYGKMDDKYFPKDNRCKVCGGSIYYNGAVFSVNKSNQIYKTATYSNSNTCKTINGKTYHLVVCQECLNKEFPETIGKKKLFNTVNRFTSFAFNVPQEECDNYAKLKAVTLENMIRRHGEAIGTKKYNDYCKKHSDKNSYEAFKQKRGWTEEQFDEYNKSRGVTLENCTRRHGEEKGTKIYNDYCKKQAYAGVKKEYFIEKYGDEEGIKKYNAMLKMKLLTLSNFIRKYGSVEGKEKFLAYQKKRNNGFSGVSQEIFNLIDKYLFDKHETFYAEKNYEYSIEQYLMDYFIKDLNITIEFNGDFWHANPNYYEEDEILNFPNHKKVKAKDLWDKDENRKKILESHGIKTIVIWEDDAKNFNVENFLKEHNLI